MRRSKIAHRLLRHGLWLAPLVVVAVPGWTDDRDLLRTRGSVPYVFIQLDSSSSMSLGPDDRWVPGGADNPGSKFYMAKEALYDVFSAAEYNFGFSTFNQDALRVRAKHWLYRPSPGPGWPLEYPDATDLWVFGQHFDPADPQGTPPAFAVAGSCAEPLDVADPVERQKLNSFPKLHLDVASSRLLGGARGGGPTQLWLRRGASVYRLTLTNEVTAVDRYYGAPILLVRARLEQLVGAAGCAAPIFDPPIFDGDLELALEREFLIDESDLGFDGVASGSGRHEQDRLAGFWDYSDAEAASDCGSSSPFSGKGWEGNYDFDAYVDETTGLPIERPPGYPPGETSDVDAFPQRCGADDEECYNLLVHPTRVDPLSRNLDRGDMLPFDWLDDNREAVLDRLAPNRQVSPVPDFGIATYFTDLPDPETGYLKLEDESQRPLLAVGGSPNAKAINDFRCWYAEKRSGQCKNARYPESWEEAAQTEIANLFGCVEPFLIVITDAENTCGGESPVADVAAMKSQAGVKTWVLALAPEGSVHGQFAAMAQAGAGELIYVSTRERLEEELKRIRGVIEEQLRTFASAAVPTVQATTSDKVYLTRFTPLRDTSFWSGHVSSFLKPLPLDPDTGKPDLGHERHLWDAGEVLRSQVDPSDPLGPAETQRRVYYSQVRLGETTLVGSGQWPSARRLLEPDPSILPGDPPSLRERDLWTGLGLVPCPLGLPLCVGANRAETERILDRLFALKSVTLAETAEELQYVLGDVFHADPLVLGGGTNRTAFLSDRHGYREFARKHENRRKLLLVGANDGMLHAFDAGVASVDSGSGEVRFDDGSGKEVFAFMPRPQVLATAERADATAHMWGVDGGINAADVHIDPSFSAAPDPDDREWRTVAITALRRGGSGYAALDLTHPDELEEVTLGGVGGTAFLPTDADRLPDCADTLGDGDLGCDEDVVYPAPLWEFDDTLWDLVTQANVPLDEDLDSLGQVVGNGLPDLGQSWSRPNLGRIRVCTGSACVEDPSGDDLEDRYVAIFGGGLPEERALWNATGNFLYVVDIETGETLAKHFLLGSAPSEPAAVDTNGDGYLDRVYIGTTLGLLYRLDLGPDESGTFPRLEDVSVRNLGGLLQTAQRIVDPAPRIVFSSSELDLIDPAAQPTSASEIASPIRPIFFPPRVLFVAALNQVALALGSGDREDLWLGGLLGDPEGRFYVFVDDSFTDPVTGAPGPILTERDLLEVEATDPNFNPEEPTHPQNLLLERATGERGWFLRLLPGERLLNTAFSISGISFFVTYLPGDIDGGECRRDGASRIYALNTGNANGLLLSAEGDKTRFIEVRDFVTRPYTEQAQTRNPPVEGEATADDFELGTHLAEVMEDLKQLFPENCRFGNHRIDIKAVTSETGLVFVAPVPVCIVQQNWKEF